MGNRDAYKEKNKHISRGFLPFLGMTVCGSSSLSMQLHTFRKLLKAGLLLVVEYFSQSAVFT